MKTKMKQKIVLTENPLKLHWLIRKLNSDICEKIRRMHLGNEKIFNHAGKAEKNYLKNFNGFLKFKFSNFFNEFLKFELSNGFFKFEFSHQKL